MEHAVDQPDVKRRLTCILAADAVGYSKQMGQDEEGTIRVLSAHRAVIDGIIAYHQGRIVSTAGDSVLAEFGSAVEAVRCAVEIQDALKTRNDALPEHRKMLFRVGVNLGDVVVKNNDLLGDGVNVAARLETMAEPGGICIASSVYDQITGKLNLGFQDIGDQTLKNISRPIHVYRVSGVMAALKADPMPDAKPVTSPPVQASRLSTVLPWALAGAMAVVLGVVVWQAGWLGTKPPAAQGLAASPVVAPVVAAVPVSAPADATRDVASLQAQAQAQLLRAQALRDQAQAELERMRAQAQAQAQAAPTVQSGASTKAKAAAAPSVSKVDAQPTRVAMAQPRSPEPAPPAAAPAFPFDGTWSVNVSCPAHRDGAEGYAVNFDAQVQGGMLRGEHGTPGQPGWLLLRGEITADGRAEMVAKGLTGDPRLAVSRVPAGSEYTYPVKAFFEGKHGVGKRQRLRACVLQFDKR